MDQNSMDPDFFDRIMSLPGFRIFLKIFQTHKSVLLYIFFGGLTTVVSIGSFVVCNSYFRINELIANIISWICAVSFAYVTNRIWVFRSNAKGMAVYKEAVSFFTSRLTTLGIEEMLLLIFVTIFRLNSLAVKIAAQFVVLILNYILSKYLVFKEKTE